MRISIRSMTQTFDEIYESWMSNLAASTLATVALAGSPMGNAFSAPPNPPTFANYVQNVNMAVPKERPKSFKEFRDRYMFGIYHTKIPGHNMLSNAAETFAGPRFGMILSSYIRQHETNGKYTAPGTKTSYIMHGGAKYVEKLPDPSGGYTIGDGLSLNEGSKVPALLAPYLHNGIAFDKDWKPITSTARLRERIQYLEATTAEAIQTAFYNQNRTALMKFLSKSGVNYQNLDAYAKLALEDLAYNQGGNISFKKMLAELAKPIPDYVRAAYEMCDCKDWESFGGLRTRRIHGAHLLLMAADRNGGLDIYKGRLLGPSQTASLSTGVQPDVSDKDEMINYSVSKGDSLWLLAKKFHSTVDEIAADNNLDPRATLPQGKILRIRPVKTENMDSTQKQASIRQKPNSYSRWHTVKPGETFSGIAYKNGVRLNNLKALNPSIDYNRISPGQKIRIS